MAVLERLPEQQIIDGFKGVIDFYLWKGIPCARKWPTWRPYRFSPVQQENQAAFAYAVALWPTLDPIVKAQWNSMAGGTARTGRDLFLRAYLKGTNP